MIIGSSGRVSFQLLRLLVFYCTTHFTQLNQSGSEPTHSWKQWVSSPALCTVQTSFFIPTGDSSKLLSAAFLSRRPRCSGSASGCMQNTLDLFKVPWSFLTECFRNVCTGIIQMITLMPAEKKMSSVNISFLQKATGISGLKRRQQAFFWRWHIDRRRKKDLNTGLWRHDPC